MTKRWVMFGASHFFGDIVDLIEDGHGRLAKVVLNRPEEVISGRPILKSRVERLSYAVDVVNLAGFRPGQGESHVMGFSGVKMKPLLEDLKTRFGLEFPSLLHSRSILQTGARVFDGTLVDAGAIIGPWSIVGRHVILNRGSNVGHDCEVGDFSFLSPGAVLCGHVRLGGGVFVGANATILPDIVVGAGAVIAAGAVVTKDVEAGVMVAGVPAEMKKRLE